MRKIFVTRPATKFDQLPKECSELLKPLHCLADSGSQWNQTLDDHIQIDQDMAPIVIDLSLYLKVGSDKILGIDGSNVDDLL